jgi:DNA invertase Pin-like site-specific DNA recombinase
MRKPIFYGVEMSKPGTMARYSEQQVLDLLNEKQNVDEAARQLRVHPQTLLRWLEKNGYKRHVKVVWTKQTQQQADCRVNPGYIN